MKKHLSLLLYSIILVSISTGAVFADEGCETCSNTSPILEKYIEFSNEMLQELENIAGEGQTNGGGDAALNQIAENLNDKQKSVSTYSVLMTTIGSKLVKEVNRQEIALLNNAKALKRDRDKLAELDKKISETLFALGKAGAYGGKLKDYNESVQQILDQYSNGDDAFIKKTGSPFASAATLITALWDLNQAYKRFLADGETDVFRVLSIKYNTSMGMIMSEVNFTTLVKQYSCARGFNACDANNKKFSDNMSETSDDERDDDNEDDSNKAIDKIRKAMVKLKCAMAKESSDECDEDGMSDPGEDIVDQDGDENEQAEDNQGNSDDNKDQKAKKADKMDKLGDAFAKQINPLHDIDIKDEKDRPANFEVSKTASLDIVSPDSTFQRASQNLSGMLLDMITTSMAISKETWQHHVFADPLVVTKKMPDISVLIQSGASTLGEQDKQKTIADRLGKACEYQCSNMGGTCYYY